MKYGLHCYLFTDSWSDGSLDILDTAKSLGADCVEVVVGDDIRFTPRLTRQRAESLGLALTIGPGGAWPTACDLSADDPAERAQGLAWHRKQVDLAAELGAVAYTGALYGHPGTVKRRVPPAGEVPRTAEGLHRLAEQAARSRVTLALEPMSHFRTHVANTPGQIMRLITLADHPNLAVLLDTYHMITEVRDYAAAIRTVGQQALGAARVRKRPRRAGRRAGALGPGGCRPARDRVRRLRDARSLQLLAGRFCLSPRHVPRCLPRWRGVCADRARVPETQAGSGAPIMSHTEPDNIFDPAEMGSVDAVIIGGGIIGAATAFFLARAGLRPVLVERRPALASLTSAHSMESFRAQFDEPENVAMMRESIAFYEAFAENTGLPDWDIGIHQQGYLFLTTEAARAGDFRRRVAGQHALGLTDVELLAGEKARQRFPYVAEEVVAATFRQRDGWLSAHQAAHGFARGASSRSCWRPRSPASCSGAAARPASRPPAASSPARS